MPVHAGGELRVNSYVSLEVDKTAMYTPGHIVLCGKRGCQLPDILRLGAAPLGGLYQTTHGFNQSRLQPGRIVPRVRREQVRRVVVPLQGKRSTSFFFFEAHFGKICECRIDGYYATGDSSIRCAGICLLAYKVGAMRRLPWSGENLKTAGFHQEP